MYDVISPECNVVRAETQAPPPPFGSALSPSAGERGTPSTRSAPRHSMSSQFTVPASSGSPAIIPRVRCRRLPHHPGPGPAPLRGLPGHHALACGPVPCWARQGGAHAHSPRGAGCHQDRHYVTASVQWPDPFSVPALRRIPSRSLRTCGGWRPRLHPPPGLLASSSFACLPLHLLRHRS